jgi:hypothetical protein
VRGGENGWDWNLQATTDFKIVFTNGLVERGLEAVFEAGVWGAIERFENFGKEILKLGNSRTSRTNGPVEGCVWGALKGVYSILLAGDVSQSCVYVGDLVYPCECHPFCRF